MSRMRALPVALVALLGAALSAVTFVQVRDAGMARTRAEFEGAAADRIRAIRERMEGVLETVRTVQAFLAAAPAANRVDFEVFVRPLLSRHAGIQAIEWIPRVSGAARSGFEKRARDEGLPAYRITQRRDDGRMVEADSRPEYYPVLYVMPIWDNERALGFDMASDPIRRRILEAAMESGELQGSGRIRLVQDNSESAGFLAVAPVYQRWAPLTTVEQRRAMLTGFALGVVRIPYVAGRSFSAPPGSEQPTRGGIDFYFYDESARPDARLLHVERADGATAAAPGEAQVRADPAYVETMDVAGRHWSIVARPSDGRYLPATPRRAWELLTAGLLMTLMLSGYLSLVLNRARAVANLVDERTAELKREMAERAHAEEALRESETRYRDLIEGSVQGIVIDVDGRPVFANQAYCDILGYDGPDQILAMDSLDALYPPGERERIRAYRKARSSGGEAPQRYEFQALRRDGQLVWLENRTRVVEWEGHPAIQSTLADVTDRKSAEEKFRLAVEAAPAAMMMTDDRGRITMVNAQAERLFGYAREELVGQPSEVLVPARHREKHRARRDAYVAAPGDLEGNLELLALRKDGSEIQVEAGFNWFRTREGPMFLTALADVTERNKVARMKSEFVSTVSHELRTPLTSIKGSLGLLRGGAMGELPEKMRSMVEIAHKNSDRLVRLISDILDVEKIESGHMDFELERAELGSLVRQAVEANTGYAGEHGVRFVLREPVPDVTVLADPDRIIQVVTNLLSNAAKFSPEGEDVQVSVARTGERVRVAVSDRGPGVPEGFHSRIFEKFAQADASDTRERGGTGLGLSICKAIVERHGGSIDFEPNPGAGTTFWFDLPAASAEGRAAPPPVPVPAAGGDRRPARVLVCEDDRDIATLLRVYLERDGFRVDVAGDAAAAREMLAATDYAAMTLDIGLPGEDGIALIRSLRADPSTRALPIVVVSARSPGATGHADGEVLDIVDWLEKPIDEQRLLSGLRHAARSGNGTLPRVLHVEDDGDVLDVVAAVVAGCAELTPARSLGAARAALATDRYDLVILDLALPDGPGAELLPELHRPDGSSIPVIVFSGTEVPGAMARSVSAALLKSVTSNDALLASIRSVIERGLPGGAPGAREIGPGAPR